MTGTKWPEKNDLSDSEVEALRNRMKSSEKEIGAWLEEGDKDYLLTAVALGELRSQLLLRRFGSRDLLTFVDDPAGAHDKSWNLFIRDLVDGKTIGQAVEAEEKRISRFLSTISN
jgi:hypothetical protein